MAILGLKIAGTVPNAGNVTAVSANSVRASIVGTASQDGWITHLGVRAGYDGSPADMSVAAYKHAGPITDLVAYVPAQTVSIPMTGNTDGNMYEWAIGPISPPAMIEAGQGYAVAIAALTGSIIHGMGGTAYTMHRREWVGPAWPDPYAATSTPTETQIVAWIVYQPNTAPTATITSHSDGAIETDLTPEFTVTFSDADTAYGDDISAGEILVYDATFTTILETSGKVAASGGSFSWTPTTPLTGGTTYWINASVWDGHDVRNTNEPGISITVGGQGTLSDLALTDIQGYVGDNTVINTTTPRITGSWSHATGESTATLTTRVLNADTDAVVREPMDTAIVVADGGTFNLGWNWPALPRGATVYRMEVKATDALGGQNEWVASDPFLVNAAPNTPVVLEPRDAVVTSYPTLRSANSDPTDDASLLSATHEVRPVGGSSVAYAATHTGSGQFTSTTDATGFPSYGEYQWRPVATDPWGLSTEGPWQAISYLAPPTVTPVVPAPDEVLDIPFPTVSWTVNRVQKRYRITVREQGGARVYYTSWIIQSPDGQHAIPVPLPNLTDYDLVIWVETSEGSTTEGIIPFRLEYESTEARSAEEQSLIATEGEAREVDEYDEIVIDGVSIPVRSVQRTDTSRFEGKVTFGDYTVDSDQLMSTWAQTAWSGGMNVADQIEGATDSRFRYARAWTQTSRALSLPLATTKFTPAYVAPTADEYAPNRFDNPLRLPHGYVMPLVSGPSPSDYDHHAWFTSGRRIYRLAAANGTISDEGHDFDDRPVNTGRWYFDPDGADTNAIWVPLGIDETTGGVQAYNPYTDTLHARDATIKAVALEAFDRKLYALTGRRSPAADVTVQGGFLRILDMTGVWNAETDSLRVPDDEEPRELVRYFDRSGNPAIAIVTDKQVWIHDAEAGEITPLGMSYPEYFYNGQGAAVWRDDGLYVNTGLGVMRLSTAGVITTMGLDRDDGLDPAITDGSGWYAPSRVYCLAAAPNFLLGVVTGGYTQDGPEVWNTSANWHDLVAWNEAGWHHIARLDYAATTHMYPTRIMLHTETGSMYALIGSAANASSDDTLDHALHVVRLPINMHSPRGDLFSTDPILYAPEGVYYSGWIDAGMRNFYKAWSHIEITLARQTSDAASPPGAVDVAYRTEDDPDTWHALGTADQFGRNVFPINTVNDVDRGLMSSRIEIMLVIRDTTGAVPLTETPIIESLVLKFIKLAQHGSAWQAYVALSDYDTHRAVGPTQIDDFLSRLSAEGSVYGPFQEMIHLAKTEEGWEERGRHRVRVAQWQRTEGTGKLPYGDGVLNIIEVKIPLGDPA